jgi:hypothetical protein
LECTDSVGAKKKHLMAQRNRFCTDFRALNAVTHGDAYPIPNITDTLESWECKIFFSKMDLSTGFYQVEIEEKDKEKTAFSTPHGSFEYNPMRWAWSGHQTLFRALWMEYFLI